MIVTLNLWGYISITLVVIAWSLVLTSEIIDFVIRKDSKIKARDEYIMFASWAEIIIFPLFLLGPFFRIPVLLSIGDVVLAVIILISGILRLWFTIQTIEYLKRVTNYFIQKKDLL